MSVFFGGKETGEPGEDPWEQGKKTRFTCDGEYGNRTGSQRWKANPKQPRQHCSPLSSVKSHVESK